LISKSRYVLKRICRNSVSLDCTQLLKVWIWQSSYVSVSVECASFGGVVVENWMSSPKHIQESCVVLYTNSLPAPWCIRTKVGSSEALCIWYTLPARRFTYWISYSLCTCTVIHVWQELCDHCRYGSRKTSLDGSLYGDRSWSIL